MDIHIWRLIDLQESIHLHKNYVYDIIRKFYFLVYFIKCLSISIREIFNFCYLMLMNIIMVAVKERGDEDENKP